MERSSEISKSDAFKMPTNRERKPPHIVPLSMWASELPGLPGTKSIIDLYTEHIQKFEND